VTEVVVAFVGRCKVSTGGFSDTSHLLEREDPQERSFPSNRRANHFCGHRKRGHSRQKLKRRVVVPSRDLNLRFIVQANSSERLTGVFLNYAARPFDGFVELAGIAQAIDNVAIPAFDEVTFRISGDEILVAARRFFVSPRLLQRRSDIVVTLLTILLFRNSGTRANHLIASSWLYSRKKVKPV
jgi:hypothetical protein